jgi:translation initiation factor 4G
VVDFKSDKKPASPAPSATIAPPPKSPAIAATPTPPPRPESTHSRAESVAAKTTEEKKADFVAQFKKQLAAEDAQKEADAKKVKDEEDAAVAQKEKEDQAAKEEAEKAAKEKSDADAEKKAADDAAEKKRLDDEEMERMIEEMEREAAEEEARENAFKEKKKIADDERKAREAKEADERLKAAERAAEELEAKRSEGTDNESAKLFAGLKKNTQFGPGAGQDSGESTPPAAEPVSTPTQPKSATTKVKPQPLKLKTSESVEPAQPTAGMTSLKSARFLAIKNEVNYPEGVQSPNPALNQGSKGGKGRPYDMSFLLQFQNVFKEKPSVDWDSKLKETVGDTENRPQSARTPSMAGGMGGRNPSRGSNIGTMGSFQGGAFPTARTLPPGTTSEQRFNNASHRGGTMTNPLAQFASRPGGPGGFPVGGMTRTASFQNMGGSSNGPNSPRVGSSRGRGGGGSHRGNKPSHNLKEEKAMPLTANMQIKDLERSQTGWQPMSRTQVAAQQAAAGHMAPDMVQRKVKAALNKMTPEKFDKIADQVLEIAGQSKNEQDGRTLRQVIQLTFEKACDEQHWSSMYAKFCAHMLNTMSTEIKDENVRDKHGNPVVGGALFRKYLLNRCQEEFEKGWEINLPDKPEGQSGEAALLSDDYYIAAAAKRRGLGLIQFIGELYKLNMLTLRIMHECVLKLLDFEGLPDESAVESLTKLLRTVGGTMFGAEAGPKMLDVYFQRVEKVMNMEALNSRLKYMLMDLCDLRRNNWVSKDAGKGPMTLQEIHQQAAAAQQQAEMERQRQNQRGGGGRSHMGRGDARSFSGGGAPPPQDFPSTRVQMDDLRKLTKGASGRNPPGGSLGPSMLGARNGSGRRGMGPGGALMGRGEDSGASSRTGTPPVQKDKEPTNANSFRYAIHAREHTISDYN